MTYTIKPHSTSSVQLAVSTSTTTYNSKIFSTVSDYPTPQVLPSLLKISFRFNQFHLFNHRQNASMFLSNYCRTCLLSFHLHIFCCCRGFGPKVISLKPIVKTLPKLLEDRDKTVREETKMLVVEVYRWIGAALKPQLANLKPVQV